MESIDLFLARGLVNVLAHPYLLRGNEAEFIHCLASTVPDLGIRLDQVFCDADCLRPAPGALQKLRSYLVRQLKRNPSPSDDLARVIDDIVDLYRLCPKDAAVFRLLCHLSESGRNSAIYRVLGLCDHIPRTGPPLRVAIHLAGLNEHEMRDCLAASSDLMESGLAYYDCDGDVFLVPGISHVIGAVRPRRDQLMAAIVGEPVTPSLRPQDFDYLSTQLEFATRVIRGALDTRARGIGILLHGEPGTGKTEISKLLAAGADAMLFESGLKGFANGEPKRSDRIASLRSMQSLLSRIPRAVILVDEAQDLFEGMFDRGPDGRIRNDPPAGSRISAYRLIESGQVPVIYTANRVSGFGEALLRRMTCTLQVRTPPAAARARIWARHLETHAFAHSEADAQALGRSFRLSPAATETAVRSVALAKGQMADITRVAAEQFQTLHESAADSAHPQGRYEPSLVTADLDLERLAEQLMSRRGPRDFSMCLFGPPGTGKSAYARELARLLDLDVLVKRYSDIADKYVGGSERNIADAFRQARDEGTMLIFDEADSLLADRMGATQRWEVTQVNEMLTWMERHPLPFVCTTNLMDRLDPGTLRRFTFKVRLGFLAPAQVRHAFQGFFGLDAPAEAGALHMLTPGDFAVVRHRADVLGSLHDRALLVRMLQEEMAFKPGHGRPIGFRLEARDAGA